MFTYFISTTSSPPPPFSLAIIALWFLWTLSIMFTYFFLPSLPSHPPPPQLLPPPPPHLPFPRRPSTTFFLPTTGRLSRLSGRLDSPVCCTVLSSFATLRYVARLRSLQTECSCPKCRWPGYFVMELPEIVLLTQFDRL